MVKEIGLQRLGNAYGYDHITFNAPDPIRTPKLKDVEPAQYWGGGPPGNSVVLYPLLFLLTRTLYIYPLLFVVDEDCESTVLRLTRTGQHVCRFWSEP